MNVSAPSTLEHTYCLTGDRNTEVVIEAIAAVCVLSYGDQWSSVPVHTLNIPLMGRPEALQPGDEAKLNSSSQGRLILRTVENGWAMFVPVGEWLGIELTPKAFDQMVFMGHLTNQTDGR